MNKLRRSNVMLTRLKKATVIVTNKKFILTKARSTLLRQLANAISNPPCWISETD